ncbi:MAG: leucyl aminopeptidase [bacterium]|nr:leucyl aminopeptidase [Gammaproteobacteria bacterium]HIL99277.1 leucyl aminopeptidase [Pseudomonadales bacterium]
MEFGTKFGNPVKTRSQCVMVGVYENHLLTPMATLLDKASGGYLRKVLKRGDIKGKVGQSALLHDVPGVNAPRVLLIGLGNVDNADESLYIQIVTSAIAALKKIPAKHTLCCILEAKAGDKDLMWKTRRLVEQYFAGTYSFNQMRGNPGESSLQLETIDLQLVDKTDAATVQQAIFDAKAVAIGVATAKDLGNTPSNICTPTYIADEAKKLAQTYDSLTTRVLDEKEMEKLGMGSFLSVGHGSIQPSKLIVIQHKGAKPKDAPHVLVGKGITFDTGGISLKPAGTMYEMIYDMCGAASVFGAMKTVAEQQLPINVVGVIAAAENMPSDRASRPGDIVTSMSGQTIEILNTDAEGRLVLCDALTYVDKFNPATVIDVATLTGACVMALGSHATALYANDDTLADNINLAGENTFDRVWRMPLWDAYQTQLNSAFADMANIGGREAGSVTAACFLSRFTKKYRWAHLDIAGTAYKGGGVQKGSTGRPVTLLTQYLMDRANEQTS